MPYDKSLPYSCPCCGYWNGDMKYDYEKDHRKEPLIKDEKIRKAVRYWADKNYINKIKVVILPDGTRLEGYESNIAIEFADCFLGLSEGKYYTITELCRESDDD